MHETTNETMSETPRRWLQPRVGVCVVLACLLAFWSVVLVVDVFNVANLREWLDVQSGPQLDTPLAFYVFFHEGGIVEHLQWLTLAACVAFGVRQVMLHGGDAASRRLWIFLSLTFVLMLMEDAGNTRHQLVGWAHAITQDPHGATARLVEGGYFLVLAGLPAAALLWYWRAWWRQRSFILWAAAGGLFYGTAAFMSWFGKLPLGARGEEVYTLLGQQILDVFRGVGDGELAHMGDDLPAQQDTGAPRPVSWYFMDFLIEESLELLGAAMLLGMAATGTCSPRERVDGERSRKP